MNKIYKVIYSKTKHMLVVVSELAHTASKSGTRSTCIRTATAFFSLFTLFVTSSAYAYNSYTYNYAQIHALYETGILLDADSTASYYHTSGGSSEGGYTPSETGVTNTTWLSYLFKDTDDNYKIAYVSPDLAKYIDSSRSVSSYSSDKNLFYNQASEQD
uniref:ESPR domain-containing protein n=1 Tax=Megasphaera sp. TaxID=2023260 RepID=UPI00257E4A0B